MRDSLVAVGLAVGLTALVVPLVAQSQGGGRGLGPVDALGQQVRRPPAPTGPAPRLPDGTIDLGDGTWVGSTGDFAQALPRGESLPLLPAAKALMASRKTTDDPLAWCLPAGVVRYTPYPFRFIQNTTHKKPTHLYVIYETMRAFRQVFMDGRRHPSEIDPTWWGHSIGRYEKDAFVIDTVGFNDRAWFDNRGMPHTEQLHTVERWTRIDAGHLSTEVLVDDPGTFSRTFTVRFQSTLGQAGDELMEYVCNENNQYGIASGIK